MANQKKQKPKTEVEVEPISELTKVEEFYVDNNSDKTEVELAKELGRNVETIKQHLHRTQGSGRVGKLMIREKGCVIMTAGASEAADEARVGYVSQEKINAAAMRGDFEEAARLQSLMKANQARDSQAAQKASEDHIYHFKSPKKSSRR